MAALGGELPSIGRMDRNGTEYKVTETNIQSLPDSIGKLTALQMLDLGGCKALEELPESIGNLTALQTLSLFHCEKLKKLRESIVNLTALQELNLEGCKALAELPASIGNLTALQELHLCNCKALKELPASIGNLTALQTLSLIDCEKLKELPESMGNLTALQRLNLSFCRALAELPASIGNLTALQTLRLIDCEKLKELPESMGNLTALQRLNLYHCKKLEQLPASIGNLTALQRLNLYRCEKLEELPESIGNLAALHTLNLEGCKALAELPAPIGNLTALRTLYLSNCRALEKLPESIGNLNALQMLNLCFCEALAELPASISNLTALQTLDLEGCSVLEELPESMGNLWLKQLICDGCPCFEGVPGGLPAMKAVAWALEAQGRRRNVEALLGQREILLTSVERMSWIGILFATATFVGFLNPPGSFSNGKLAMHYEAAPLPPGSRDASREVGVANGSLLRAFFVMDQLSFFASLATVVVAVASSMPSTVYKSRMMEASKIWALLVVVSVLLSVAIVCGFLAFTFAALCLYPPQLLRADVVGPVVFGACLVVAGLWYHACSLWRSSPGLSNVWRWLRAGCLGWCCCCGRVGDKEGPVRAVELSDAAEANRLLKEQSDQAKRTNALLAALTRVRLSRGPDGYELVVGDENV